MARRRNLEVKVEFEVERGSERALLQAYLSVQPVARRPLRAAEPIAAKREVTADVTEIRRRQRQVG